ncbi:39S ribosomal protein L15, mitochondrial-like, partial [Suncus etruscus]|uniref:39S ribosomal protein L15, mitochondrial-like n=1 Tax=Suncus etruscus TaxID=109475 RepID=UPI00210F7351
SGSGSGALDLLRALPRVSLANLKPNPGFRKPERRPRGRRRGRKCGRGHKGEQQRGTRPRLGFEGGQTPFYIRIPKYGFNEGHSFRRQYQPLSLNRFQYLIDLGRVDPTQPIDITQLVNGRGVTIQPFKRDYGVQLVEEGADSFTAKVNIEVQLASELAIAAIEKNGGVVTTAFYDPRSLEILCKPVPFFLRGQPIPKRWLLWVMVLAARPSVSTRRLRVPALQNVLVIVIPNTIILEILIRLVYLQSHR